MSRFKHLLGAFSMLLFGCLSQGCESSIDPITQEDRTYSIYGPLNIFQTPNYIRVHDNKAPLSEEGTLPLDVEMTFTNLSTGETEVLEDSIVAFDNVYTHNFQINMPVQFDERYRISMQDEKGVSYDITSVTTKQTDLTVLKDSVTCISPFRIRLTNIDLAAGERLDAEVAIKVGQQWLWTPREMARVHDEDLENLTLSWTPYSISEFVFGPFDAISCNGFSSEKIRFRFTHVGYVEGDEQSNEGDENLIQPAPDKQIVLSKYSGETEIQIHPCEFDVDESCAPHHDLD
ncbi:MAG: hypothetical protein JJ953_06910 [Gracilimonas sp.]|uniref:hypothetical protein n=1 Tax=Gracilimonas TaxID=649462 RepID=UPI001B24C6A1|nr:hypothetical protein [Gracilimonas sp.]MBO6585819.1 hypothetical protein [Gracilimonas sp.]MBO6616816.1 hypothetical protein [Gracilimonas sp.]